MLRDLTQGQKAIGLIILFCACFLRFYGLNTWDLAVDEYYLATSVVSVSENGIPNFPDGGYYNRGLLQQYLTAPLFLLTGDIELSVRLIPAFTSILSLFAVFLIARTLTNANIALAAMALYGLSLWEIEFARFGRMYAPFQALFLWQCYFLIKHYQDNSDKNLSFAVALGLLSIIVYEGAIFSLLAAMFAVFIHPFALKKIKYVGLILVGLVTAILMNRINFRNTATTTQPIDTSSQAKSLPIHLPDLIMTQVNFGMIQIAILIIAILITLVLIKVKWSTVRLNAPNIIVSFLSILMVAVLLANQIMFGAILCLVIMLLESTRPNNSLLGKILGLYPMVFAVWACAWIGIMVLTPDLSFKTFYSAITSTPEIIQAFVWPWQEAMPTQGSLMIAITGMVSAGVLFLNPEDKDVRALKVILGLFWLLLIATCIMATTYNLSRYTYYLHPLLLITFVSGLFLLLQSLKNELLATALMLVPVLGFAAVSENYDLDHLGNLSSSKYNYRVPYDIHRQMHFYIRFDNRTPAEFVNQHLSDSEKVLTSAKVADHYLSKVDYTYIPGNAQAGLQACGGSCYIWNASPLISDRAEFEQVVNAANNDLWVIAYLKRNQFRTELDQYIEENYSNKKVYENFDGSIGVFKF